MPRGKATGGKAHKRPIDRYEHKDKKRINNPLVGLVTPETDPPLPTHKVYDYVTPVPSVPVGRAPSPVKLDYDPHLDPQLVWAGKKEHTSFEVHTASLHLATDLGTELYSTKTNSTRDDPGPPVKFTVPTIANGKVYITTQTSLVVYGLLE